MNPLVCPECEHDVFVQTRTTRTEFRLTWDSEAGPSEISEETVDCGDLDDSEFTCDDCGFSFSLEDEELLKAY